MGQQPMTDEVGVRFGIGSGLLFLLTAVAVTAGLPGPYAVGLLLVATTALAASLEGPYAVGLGVLGWAFATGFAVNTLGELTVSPPDLRRLGVFVAAAVLIRCVSFAE